MSIEWGLPTVWELLKGAVNLIRSPVKYAMSSKSFADRLREEVQSLENEARRVDDFAQGARNNLRIPNDCFTEWQQSANKAMQEARNLLVAFDEASKTCCYGTLPDPYSRYRFSTKAKAKIKVVQEIARNCIRFRALDDICLTDARRKGKDAVQATTATASVFPASKSIKLRDAGVFESRALMIQKITEALASKSNSAVGVYGMGGVGKSTLLEEVERMLREKQSYDWVAKADVTENPNIKTIQEEIANGLRLTDLKKEETIGGRAKLLRERLETEEREKKSVLIILDNLWEGLDLKSVGIPCGYDNKVIGCKLLLTSRDQRVLRRKMRCDKDFLLAELEEEESKRLFEMMVGGKVQDELEPLVEEALNICSGVLGSLTKLEELYMEDSFNAWNAVELTPGTNANLRELNNMENLCTLYVSIPDPSVLPKDLNFERLTKFKIQMGEPWRWESCNGLSMLELKLDPESDVLRNGCIQSILGKTDDLFLEDLNGSEQSIYMLSHKGFPQLKHLQVKNSSSVHYILQSSSRADFEKLESLLLERLIRLEKICHGRISSKSFGALKVIRVKSCDSMEVLLPLSVVRGLLQLEEIAVDDCKLMCGIVEVDDRGKLELPKLRVLKLYDLPNIKSFFTDGTASSSRTSDDQVGTPIAFFNGQQVSIPSLESLTMEGLPNLKEIWSDESPLELSNLQFINIKQCQSLSKVIGFRSLMNLQKLRTLTIRSCTSMQEIFYLEASGGGGNYRTLSERVTFSLEELAVYDCDNLRFVFFPFMVKPLAQLRDLQVSWCKKMEAIIMEEEPLGLEISETLAFPMLTKLHLRQLESLICFSCKKSSREAQCHDLVQLHSIALFNREVIFPRLETLKIIGLDDLRFIFFPSVVESLSQVRDLIVSKCNKMKAIIMEEEGLGLETGETEASPKESEVAFHQLKYIKLDGLRELTCFSSVGHNLMFPLLEDVILGECPNMKFFSKGPIEALN